MTTFPGESDKCEWCNQSIPRRVTPDVVAQLNELGTIPDDREPLNYIFVPVYPESAEGAALDHYGRVLPVRVKVKCFRCWELPEDAPHVAMRRLQTPI